MLVTEEGGLKMTKNTKPTIQEVLENLAHEVEAVKFDGSGNVNISLDKSNEQITAILKEAIGEFEDLKEIKSDSAKERAGGRNEMRAIISANLKERGISI